MNRWQPCPDDLVAEADRVRWSKDRPAPGVVGYLIAWRVLRDGGRLSNRVLADHLGWSRWSASQTLKRVRDDLERWRQYTAPASASDPVKTPEPSTAPLPLSGPDRPLSGHSPATHRPPSPSIVGGLRGPTGHSPATHRPICARVLVQLQLQLQLHLERTRERRVPRRRTRRRLSLCRRPGIE